MKYSGTDLHSNYRVVVVSEETDRVLVRRRVENDSATVVAILEPYWKELAGVVV